MTPAAVPHPFAPVYDARSRVLILGSFPSPRSRAFGFYYGHPLNIFWDTLARVLEREPPAAEIEARRAFLLENRVALWDVLASCEIRGASDASIRAPIPNVFRPMLERSEIRAIFCNGRTAADLFGKHCAEEAGRAAVYL
ncbi:MAG: DNA-deoxyinosine glycosylase, partial [Oscillospiraceae bacterium]|nr:DNA-deoxyinosine glycosylase [Oscillospiraceae bacterium]